MPFVAPSRQHLKPGARIKFDAPQGLAIRLGVPAFSKVTGTIVQMLPMRKGTIAMFVRADNDPVQEVRVSHDFDSVYGATVLVERDEALCVRELRASMTRAARAVPQQWALLLGGPLDKAKVLLSDPTCTLPLQGGAYTLDREHDARASSSLPRHLNWSPA